MPNSFSRIGTRAAIALAVLASWIAAPAAAQTFTEQPDPRIDYEFSFDIRHDENIAQVSRTAALARGIDPQDQRMTPQVSVEIAEPLGRHYIRAKAEAGYTFHANNDQLDRERLSLDVELGLNVATCQAKTLGEFKRRQSQFEGASDITSAFDDGYGLTKNAQTTLGIEQSVTCGGVIGLRPFAKIAYRSNDNSNTAREQANNDQFSYAVGIAYSHPLIGDANVYYQHAENRFENQILPDGSKRGFDIDRVGLHIERKIGSRFEVTGDISLPFIDTREPGIPEIEGVNWALDVRFKPSEPLRLDIGVSRDIGTSLLTDALYHRTTEFRVNAQLRVSPRTRLRAGARFQRRDYIGSAGLFGPALSGDEGQRYEASITHDLNRRLRLNFRVGHETRDANGTYFDYDNTSAMLSLDFRL